MKGIARTDDQRAADYEAVVLAFSHLSNAVISDLAPKGALTTAAETGAVLLQLDAAAVYLCEETTKAIELAATYQLELPSKKTYVPGESAVRKCIDTGAPVAVVDVAADKHKGMPALAKHGIASVLCVPLKVGEKCLGVLMGASNTQRKFTTSDVEVLAAIASQAAFAAWKSKLPSDVVPGQDGASISTSDIELIELANRKIQELAIINKVSEGVISTLDLNQLLDLALDQCLFAVGATVGSIMLLDEEAGTLTIKAAKGLPQEVVEIASTRVGEGIAGWVAEHGQPVLVHDARKDPRFRMYRYRDDITSAMSVPLKARGRVIGVLNANTVEKGRRFGPREVEFLSTIANQVAMAIDNAQLYDRLSRRSAELASLLQISEAITSILDLRQVVTLLSQKFMAMTHVEACVILGYDAETDRFRYLDGQGLTNRKRKSAYLELSLPVATLSISSGNPVMVGLDPKSDCFSEIAQVEGYSTAACIPLTASGRKVGAVALFSCHKKPFSEADIQTLGALGGLAGVAVHNALVYQHTYDIARSLQFKLVPTVPLTAEGLDIGHRFLPAREVGGDYYDIINVAPGRVGVVIADVAGNSVPAAIYTSMGKHVLRAYAVEDNAPADVITRTNRLVCEETTPEVFISLFYGVFDAGERVFRYSCAGHEPPILYRPDGSVERLRADGLLVGINPNIEFEEKEVKLEPGSILALFTDGLTDSPAARGKFGVDDVAAIIAEGALKPAQELADNIYTRLMEIAGKGTQDDVALVVLKVL
ncbi:MAG TPA: GAF domain-containing protein [Armatimonadota bacterium]|jgi:GAF domain-containing protein|nr:GAF domain-containing protein [Armatimonadota bacterium]